MSIKKVLSLAQESGVALTFDDVTLMTKYSKVLPKDVNLETKFSKNVSLKIPIVSAAMDTVTEKDMAIELAILGGLGIIHKNMTIQEQVNQVSRVKHHLSGFIEKPICVYSDEKISNLLERKSQKGYNFHSFPVVNKDYKLEGIVTKTDFDFCNDDSLLIKEIMTPNILTAKEGTEINQAYEIMSKNKKKVLPLVDNNNKIIGMYVFSDVKRIISGGSKNYNLDKNKRLKVGAAVGIGKDTQKRVDELAREGVDVVVVDSAHADTVSVIKTIKDLKKFYHVDVVAGNITNPDSAKRLIDSGVDGIKVGQGPGGICTTRVIAGVGIPQISAIYECASVAKNYNIPICADGGLRCSGDVVKAIAAGANSVMMGGMLAGTKEAPGDLILFEGRQWKTYRGMGSLGAMKDHEGSRERYLQESKGKLIPEGVEARVPYKGELSEVIFQYTGGLRSGMGYVGAKTIEELKEKGDFKKITLAGKFESHPHDIQITKDAPNYTRE